MSHGAKPVTAALFGIAALLTAGSPVPALRTRPIPPRPPPAARPLSRDKRRRPNHAADNGCTMVEAGRPARAARFAF